MLGSIPLLSFRVAAVQPSDNISRKHTFKVSRPSCLGGRGSARGGGGLGAPLLSPAAEGGGPAPLGQTSAGAAPRAPRPVARPREPPCRGGGSRGPRCRGCDILAPLGPGHGTHGQTPSTLQKLGLVSRWGQERQTPRKVPEGGVRGSLTPTCETAARLAVPMEIPGSLRVCQARSPLPGLPLLRAALRALTASGCRVRRSGLRVTPGQGLGLGRSVLQSRVPCPGRRGDARSLSPAPGEGRDHKEQLVKLWLRGAASRWGNGLFNHHQPRWTQTRTPRPAGGPPPPPRQARLPGPPLGARGTSGLRPRDGHPLP